MIKWLLRKLIGLTPSQPTTTDSSRTDTEFSAEVVRITQILPHPNADRLEIARFEMKGIGETTYEVVVQKGSMKPGDLQAYFSVDCVLPTAHPEFAFLTTREDGAGKTEYRLRAARLRKVFSQGLLVPCPAGLDFGAPVAELFGVTYYSPPVRGVSGPTAPSAKPKAQPCPVYGVDSLKKMPRLFELGEPVFVTEKIHGTNFRFGWVRRRILGIPFGWKFVVGSHRVMKGSAKTGHFYGEDLWQQAADKMNLAERTRGHRGMVFYGELYGYTYSGQKIQDLTYGVLPSGGPRLAVFDIRDMVTRQWLPAFEREDVCSDLGLESPPVLAAAELWDPALVGMYENRKSAIHKGTVLEGVVVESLVGPRRKAKWVSQAYLLREGA